MEPARFVASLLLALVIFFNSFVPAFATTINYIHTNNQGSVMEITDSRGNVLERERYYAYGENCTDNLKLNT